MHVGLLTARFPADKSFAEIARWAGEAGFAALEVATQHLAPGDVLADGGAAVKELLAETGLRISSLAHYQIFNRCASAEAYAAEMREVFAAAEALGVDTVCALAGFPVDGKSKLETIQDDVKAIFGPLAREAADRGLRIAFENWFATNLQNLDHFAALVEAVAQDNVGFNFDPSHLEWQQIDTLAAVEEFGDQIFHTHAKDVAIRRDKRARMGVLEFGWWRYVIPGFGEIDWGRYILALKEISYEGVLSIEHEDSAFEAEEGFEKGLVHLRQFV